ncbi:MAG: carbon starvation protein A [Lachnospiraceae bacterium]|nr:carbon starvation protein A [Lachnospiraceae bacterium]
MNSLVILLIAAVCLVIGYVFYGGYLVKTWGIDPDRKTPAVEKNDGVDYVPTSKFTVFAHQFSSIAGAGPVQGPILASMFGWVPVLLWLLFGGIFFGAVQDFGSLYASVKNSGKSITLVIEKYIGKTGRRVFTMFCWLFCLLVIAAFTSMCPSTFAPVIADGTSKAAAQTTLYNGASAGSISLLFIAGAIVLGLFLKKTKLKNEAVKAVIAIALVVAMYAIGMHLPIYLSASQWNFVIMAYIFVAALLPMWLLMEPRDYMTTFSMLFMIIGAVVGIFVAHPSMKLNAFNGFAVVNSTGAKQYLFPTLFVTIACGAISGFHSLVSSGTTSKTIRNEKDMKFVGYGAMLLETLVGVISLIVVGAVAKGGLAPANQTPFAIFSSGVAGFFELLGIPNSVANVFMTMCVSALALTTLDSVARLGKMFFQELFRTEAPDSEKSATEKILTNPIVATLITLVFGYILCLGGYQNIWALFGSANQMLGAVVLLGIAVFLKATNRKNVMLFPPMIIMIAVTYTAIIQNVIGNVKAFASGQGTFLINGMQLIVAAFLIILGAFVIVMCFKSLARFRRERISETAEA